MYQKIFFCLALAFITLTGFTQNTVDPNGYNIFYYENGVKSSEGTMRDGKPDGYWKTYNENGIIKSEGNRKEFLLDGLWKFYNDDGKVIMEVNYKKDRKNGIRKTWQDEEIIEENFIDNIKQGYTKIYFVNGILKKEIPFEDGYEQGIAKTYNENGLVISIFIYKKGYLTERNYINRLDSEKKPHGKWMWFYETGELKKEGFYVHGEMEGYFKEYTIEGDLITIEKFEDNELVTDAPELQKLEIKTEYYDNGTPKIVASFKNGVPEGVRREYDTTGIITAAYIFKNGNVTGEGIIDEGGVRHGDWTEYYESGELKAKGKYSKGKFIGDWIFYYKNGEIEQEGYYTKEGEADGTWTWYYENGNVRREENYYLGMKDGSSVEYDVNGEILAKGSYSEDLEEGEWIHIYNDHIEKGAYRSGLRFGLWEHFDANDNLLFKGKYIDGNENGRHIFYWENGKKKESGKYVMGRKDGVWVKYDMDGLPIIMITFKGGRETEYDGIKVKPSLNL